MHLCLKAFSIAQPLSCVWLFATPWTATPQASLSFTISWSLLKLIPIELVMPSKYLALCHPPFLLPSVFPSVRSFLMSQLFASGGQSSEASTSASVLPIKSRDFCSLVEIYHIAICFYLSVCCLFLFSLYLPSFELSVILFHFISSFTFEWYYTTSCIGIWNNILPFLPCWPVCYCICFTPTHAIRSFNILLLFLFKKSIIF